MCGIVGYTGPKQAAPILLSGLSKLEGQIRYVTDFELAALANILNVSVDWLLGRDE